MKFIESKSLEWVKMREEIIIFVDESLERAVGF